MKKDKPYVTFRKILSVLESFFGSWRFPVFMLSVLFFFTLVVLAIMMIPVSETTAGTFAREFKTWCLGYDPATGEIEYIYLVMFVVQPAILSLFIWMFWYKPLAQLIKEEASKAVPYMGVALIVVLSIGLTLPSFFSTPEQGELPFPEKELRTDIIAPPFTLTNQHKKKISLTDYRGEVVILTSVYASCHETCPMILERVKQLFETLDRPASEQLQLMAVTMDPAKDTPRMLKMTAEKYGLTAPNHHLLTGKGEYVNNILDKLNIPRRRRADGAINHANIFILIDKKGEVAYRFTLGDRQQKWLLKATRLLVEESPGIAKKDHRTIKKQN